MPGAYDAIAVQPDDRVLVLGLAPSDAMRSLAQRASRGIVVGIGREPGIYAARRALADVDNVMFVPAAERLEIPWRDEFFTKVIALEFAESTPEMLRVLVPGGAVYLSGSVVTKASA
jgi:hypothetical protein